MHAAVRQYQYMFGGGSAYTCVNEWEYDGFASWQESMAGVDADPKRQALIAEDTEKGITIDQRNELYTLLDV